MFHGLIRWSLAQRLPLLVLAALTIVWGGWQASTMPVDVFPDLTAPTITVVAEAHGMAPQEVESQITLPLETALLSATGVRRVRSNTGIGNALVTVEFGWDTSIRDARQIVSEKLQQVRAELPPDLDPPVMGPISSVMGEILFIALTSEQHSPVELRTEADWLVYQRIASVPGISQVVPLGGGVRQYQVVVSPTELARLEIGINDVVSALEKTNENVSAGFYEDQGREYLIYGLGRIKRPDDIGQALITLRGDRPITIADVAEVTIGPALKRGEGALNGRDAVIIAIQKQPDANTLALTAELDALFDDLETSLPEGMELHRSVFRQADFIDAAIHNVLSALRNGSLLVILIILLFLASLRATAITAAAIPLSLVVAVFLLNALGGTINTMVLGGMAIAVGVLVDDAIVVVENILRRLQLHSPGPDEEDLSTDEIIAHATDEVTSPLVYANLAVFLVFIPLLFLESIEGRLLQPLGLAFIISVAASLIVAVTVTPALCSFLLKDQPRSLQDDPWLVRHLKRAYAPLLDLTLRRWKLLSALSLIAVLLAALSLTQAGRSFLPEFNEGTLTVSAVTLPGTSLATSHEMGTWVEETLHSHPEVITTGRRTGRAERDEHAQGVHASEIDVTLRMGDRSREDFLHALRDDLATIPGVQIAIDQPITHRIDHMLTGTRANIAIKLYGDDLYELRSIATQIRDLVEPVPGAVDVNVEQQTDIPFLLIDLDRPAIARHGLSVYDVTHALETALLGTRTTRIFEGQRSFDLLVRYPDATRESVDAIQNTLITTPAGAAIPLHALAEIRRDRRPNSISRENGRRLITITANVAGADLVGVVQEIDGRVAETIDLPEGYQIEFGGQFERAQEATRQIALLSLFALLAVFLLLYMALNSLRDALLVLLNLPLALIGGVATIFLLDGILSVATLIGLIALFGIALRNGLLLVSHIHHLHLIEGVADIYSAVRRASLERLSPILMTALASGLGLLPLATRIGQPGGELQGPMAVVILGGLVTATFLNMVVIPALYLRFGALAAKEH